MTVSGASHVNYLRIPLHSNSLTNGRTNCLSNRDLLTIVMGVRNQQSREGQYQYHPKQDNWFTNAGGMATIKEYMVCSLHTPITRDKSTNQTRKQILYKIIYKESRTLSLNTSQERNWGENLMILKDPRHSEKITHLETGVNHKYPKAR